jgi:Transposase DDE domain
LSVATCRSFDVAAPCPFKMRCCPKEPARKIPRNTYEEARDIARALAKTAAFEQSRHDRKRVEMLFAHLKRIPEAWSPAAAWAPAAHRTSSHWRRSPQNLRRLAKLAAQPPPAAAMCPG